MAKTIVELILGTRPTQKIIVTTKEGHSWDLGRQVSGDDLIARFFQWQQTIKINKYCKERLKTLSGAQRQEFQHEMNRLKETRRG